MRNDWSQSSLLWWWVKVSWKRKWQPTPVFLPGESHGQRSLAGYHPWVAKRWTQLKTRHFRPGILLSFPICMSLCLGGCMVLSGMFWIQNNWNKLMTVILLSITEMVSELTLFQDMSIKPKMNISLFSFWCSMCYSIRWLNLFYQITFWNIYYNYSQSSSYKMFTIFFFTSCEQN